MRCAAVRRGCSITAKDLQGASLVVLRRKRLCNFTQTGQIQSDPASQHEISSSTCASDIWANSSFVDTGAS